MNNRSSCPNCAHPLPGGRFTACPFCGFDLSPQKNSIPSPTAGITKIKRNDNNLNYSADISGSSKTAAEEAAFVLHERAELCQKTLYIFILMILIANFTPVIWEFWSFNYLRNLIAQHGYGNIPIEKGSFIESSAYFFALFNIVFLLINIFLFSRIIYISTKTLDDLSVTSRRWSAGWSVASLFIPFLNLYRPWAGLNELDQTLRHLANTSPRPDSSFFVSQRGVGLPTILYASFIFLSAFIDKIFISAGNEIAANTFRDQISFYQYADSREKFLLAALLYAIINTSIHSVYWLRVIKQMRAASKNINLNKALFR